MSCCTGLSSRTKLLAFFRAQHANLITSVTLHMLFLPLRMPSPHIFATYLWHLVQVSLPLGLFPPVLAHGHLGICTYLVTHFPSYTGHLEDWNPALFNFLSQVPTIVLSTWWFLRKYYKDWTGLLFLVIINSLWIH